MTQDKEDIKQQLAHTSLQQILDEAELTTLSEHAQLKYFKAGDLILSQGKKSDGLYFILQGKVIITAKILGEGITQIAVLSRDNFIGEISAIDQGLCATSVSATEDVVCLFISTAAFNMYVLFFPALKHKLMTLIIKEVFHRIVNLRSKIIELMTQTDMPTRSMFSEMIQSFSRPKTISLTEADIAQEDVYSLPIFSNFTREEVTILLDKAYVISAATHTELITEGEKHAACYLILHGAVQANIINEGKVAKLAVLSPKTIFGTLSSINHALLPSIINYTTCERAQLLMLNENTIAQLKESNIFLWYKLYDLICISFIKLERSVDKLEVRLSTEIYNR